MKEKYLKLALPSGFECIIGVLITMTDTFMISKLGSGVIASVGAMGTVIDFMYLILQAINVSNNVMVARTLGKNDFERIKITTGTSLIIAIFCSFLCIGVTLTISGFLPALFKIDNVGLIYLYIRLAGVLPNTILTILSGYQRALGNSKRMLNVRIFCFITNAILDFILVTMGFNVMGVAIATVMVEVLNMLILIFYCRKNVKLSYDKDIAKEQISLIKYNAYERVFKRGSTFIMNIIMSRIGAIAYAAHLVVMQFLDLINNFLHGTGIGTQTMVATALGSENKQETKSIVQGIKKINKKMIYIITLCIGISMLFLLPVFLLEKESLDIAYKLIIFVLIDCVLSGFYHYYSSVLRAMKEFKYISKLSFYISVVLKLLLMFILANIWNIYGVWICFLISDIVMDIYLNKPIRKLLS